MITVAVSGHRGLSAEVAKLVHAGIDEELERLRADDPSLTGLSCLADGADQIFARAVLDHDGSLQAVIPAEKYRDGLPQIALPEYDELLRRASVVYTCPYRESTSESHMYASKFMVDRADRLIAVWDGQPARGYGGTADVVRYARDRGILVSVVWPAGVSRD